MRKSNTTHAIQPATHIVFYGGPHDFGTRYLGLMGVENVENPCPEYPECTGSVTIDTSSADVVLYAWPNSFGVGSEDSIFYEGSEVSMSLAELSADQTSVLFSREANLGEAPASVQSSANIHMGTFFDADIKNPRWLWTKEELQLCLDKGLFYYRPMEERSRFAIAITSHCVGRRMQFLKALAKIIPLDIYGNCTGRQLPREDEHQIIPDYKFFLSVENTEQCGYTSEKLMRGLRHAVVPVYFGDPCIGDAPLDFTDSKWFIDVRDFQSTGELGDYLLRLNDTAELDDLLSWRTELSQDGNSQLSTNTRRLFPDYHVDDDWLTDFHRVYVDPLGDEYAQTICGSLGPGHPRFRNAAFCTLCDRNQVMQLKHSPHAVRPAVLER